MKNLYSGAQNQKEPTQRGIRTWRIFTKRHQKIKQLHRKPPEHEESTQRTTRTSGIYTKASDQKLHIHCPEQKLHWEAPEPKESTQWDPKPAGIYTEPPEQKEPTQSHQKEPTQRCTRTEGTYTEPPEETYTEMHQNGRNLHSETPNQKESTPWDRGLTWKRVGDVRGIGASFTGFRQY